MSVLSYNIYDEAVRLANTKLSTTRALYINSLKQTKIDNKDTFLYTIYLSEGSFANKVEEGMPAFDQKPFMLNSPKAKLSKDGNKYITIPFKHQPYSKMTLSPKATDIRKDLRKVLKDNSIEKHVKDFGGGKKMIHYKGIENPYLKNLVKVVDKKTNSSQYFTFRRVSTKTPSWKWIHPGLPGIRIFSDLEKYTQENINLILGSL